jgi:hypothetical protein
MRLPKAVLQLVSSEAEAIKWRFPQENATLQDFGDSIEIGEPP